MSEKEYVIVINRKRPIPLRNIVELIDPRTFNEEDFKKWYYDQYFELDHDEFIHCKTRKERDDFLITIQ